MEGCRPGVVQDSPTSLAIHPKGSKVKGKYCYIYVNTDDEYVANGQKLTSRSAAGVWVLDLETFSLTHRYALTDGDTAYGDHIVDRSGPLLITNTPETRLMVGGSVNSVEGVWMEGSVTPQGYFTTVRHEADSVSDTFESFTVKHDTLAPGETITVKYKAQNRPNYPLTVTDVNWLDTTRFTTLNALTDAVVGDEVELLTGAYAGYSANITSIEGVTTKTVTVDTAIGVAGTTVKAEIDNWKVVDRNADSTTGEYLKTGAAATHPSRQHKVVMKGNVTVRETISKSNSKVEL
jgi:hypothetical protein